MQGLLVRWLVCATALWLTSRIASGIQVDDFSSLLLAAAAIGLLNASVRPVLFLFTLPLTFLTLGFFILVLNAGMLWLASALVPGFHVGGFWSALWGWLLLSLFTFAINVLIGDAGRLEIIHVEHVVRY
jgi:putative membrane protein